MTRQGIYPSTKQIVLRHAEAMKKFVLFALSRRVLTFRKKVVYVSKKVGIDKVGLIF